MSANCVKNLQHFSAILSTENLHRCQWFFHRQCKGFVQESKGTCGSMESSTGTWGLHTSNAAWPFTDGYCPERIKTAGRNGKEPGWRRQIKTKGKNILSQHCTRCQMYIEIMGTVCNFFCVCVCVCVCKDSYFVDVYINFKSLCIETRM